MTSETTVINVRPNSADNDNNNKHVPTVSSNNNVVSAVEGRNEDGYSPRESDVDATNVNPLSAAAAAGRGAGNNNDNNNNNNNNASRPNTTGQASDSSSSVHNHQHARMNGASSSNSVRSGGQLASRGTNDAMNLTIANSVKKAHQGGAASTKSIYGAAFNGKADILESLFESDHKALENIDQPYKDGTTALHAATNAGHDNCVKVLLQHGANVNAVATNGATPLCFACSKGHVKCVELLLKAGATLAVEVSGWSPLHLAVSRGHHEVVQKLLEAENGNAVDLELPASNGHTPVAIAIQNGHVKVLEVLLGGGANPNTTVKGWAPLHISVLSKSIECVELLLEAGAELDMKKDDGVTPLFLASEKNYPEMIKVLAKAGANLELTARNHATPLWMAVRRDNIEAAKALIRAGASTIASVSGWPCLHVACEQDEVEILNMMLDSDGDGSNPIDVAQINSEGNTALHVACENGSYDCVKALCDYEFTNIDQMNRRRATPLCVACHFGFLEICELLIEKGADVHVQIEGAWSPATIAADRGHGDIVDMLEKRGAIANTSDTEGMNPLNVGPRVMAGSGSKDQQMREQHRINDDDDDDNNNGDNQQQGSSPNPAPSSEGCCCMQ